MTPRSVALVVDPVACDGYGYCAELVPEWIAADEWGFPVVRQGAVPPELIGLVRRAVADCPRRALHLVDAAAGTTPPSPGRVVLATTRR